MIGSTASSRGISPGLAVRMKSLLRVRAKPASSTIAAMTTLTTAAAHGRAPARSMAMLLAGYRGKDLLGYHWWRLPLSAFLAQGVLQWASTVLLAMTALAGIEAIVGTVRFTVLVASAHIVPTVMVAAWAEWSRHSAILLVSDYGTSCLIMGALGAAMYVWRSRIGCTIVALGFIADSTVHSPTTVAEHVMAVLIGIAVMWLAASANAPTHQPGGVELTTGRFQPGS